MATAARRLADQIRRTLTGPMWHGPALDEALRGITPAEAMRRPIVGAHSIWELVLHIAVWAEVALTRLGPEPQAAPPEDWPPVPSSTPANWDSALERLHVSYERLAQAVQTMDDAQLRAEVAGPSPRHSVEVMLHGVVEHGTYHGGQIVLLRRALAQ